MCWEVAFLLYNMTGPPVLCKIYDYCVLYQVMKQLFHLPLHSVIAYFFDNRLVRRDSLADKVWRDPNC